MAKVSSSAFPAAVFPQKLPSDLTPLQPVLSSELTPSIIRETHQELRRVDLAPTVASSQGFILSSFIVGTPGDDTLSGTWRRDFIFGLGGDDTLQGWGGNDWLFGGDGRDRMYGGSGNDRFYDVSGGNLFDGGSGTDTVLYSGITGPITLKYDIDLVDTGNGGPPDIAQDFLRVYQNGLPPDELVSVEVLVGPAGQPNTIDFQAAHYKPKYSPLPPTKVAPPIDVNLSQSSLSFDGITMTVENFQNVIGSRGDDSIIGNGGVNVLDGNLGSNQLTGLGGNDVLKTFEKDTLTGGSGADTFVLRAAWRELISQSGGWQPGAVQASQIVDFESGVDKIQLNATQNASFVTGSFSWVEYNAFESLSVGALDPTRFYVLGSGNPVPTEQHIQYDDTTGDLFYTGIMGSSTFKFARLQGSPTLTASDFEVV
ncbi:MAG: calcium-binding protein [Cyanobacteria bacterium P01_A01_bin.105]